MKAKADSWTRRPFVAGIAVPYQASFTPAQFERMTAGLVPEQWDGWFGGMDQARHESQS